MRFCILTVFFALSACATAPKSTELPTIPRPKSEYKRARALFIRHQEQLRVEGSHIESLFQDSRKWAEELGPKKFRSLQQHLRGILETAFVDELGKFGLQAEIVDRDKALAFLGSENTDVWVLNWDLLRLNTYGDGMGGLFSAGDFWTGHIEGRFSRGSEKGETFSFTSDAVRSPCPESRDEMQLSSSTDENPVVAAARLLAREWLKSNSPSLTVRGHDVF